MGWMLMAEVRHGNSAQVKTILNHPIWWREKGGTFAHQARNITCYHRGNATRKPAAQGRHLWSSAVVARPRGLSHCSRHRALACTPLAGSLKLRVAESAQYQTYEQTDRLRQQADSLLNAWQPTTIKPSRQVLRECHAIRATHQSMNIIRGPDFGGYDAQCSHQRRSVARRNRHVSLKRASSSSSALNCCAVEIMSLSTTLAPFGMESSYGSPCHPQYKISVLDPLVWLLLSSARYSQ
jgi:hypothetical protein